MSRVLSFFSWLTPVGGFLFVGILYLTIFASQQKVEAIKCQTGPGGTYATWCGAGGIAIQCYVERGGDYRERAAYYCTQDCNAYGYTCPAIAQQPSCSSLGGSCYHRLSCAPDYSSLSGGDEDCSRFGNFSCCGPRSCYSLGGNCVPNCAGIGGTINYSGNNYCSSISGGYAGQCCVVAGVPPAPPPAGPPPPPPPPRYDINGYVWIDKNRDGGKQSSEPYYTGSLTVRLSGGASATTDPSAGTPGPYVFYNYLAGNYTVSLDSIPANYDATTATSHSFFLNADRYNVNFGIVPYYSISGNVFNDLNKNRIKDLIDPDTNPVMESNITSGITITTNGGNLSVNSPAATYNIAHLYEGAYNVSYTSAIPAGYFMIYPLNGPPPQFSIYVGDNCYQNINLSFGSGCNNGNAQNVNFAISNSIPWFQSYGLNMRLDEGFEDKIPTSPVYAPYASVSDNANGSSNLVTPTPTPTPTPTRTPTPTPVPPTPTPAPTFYGNCTTGDGRSGKCYDRSVASCGTYYDAGWYCPGGDAIQCCVNNNVTCRSGTGSCHNRYANPSYIVGSNNGNIYACNQTWYSGGYCPGPFDVQCCGQ